jgi:predicted metal-dependent peptidase
VTAARRRPAPTRDASETATDAAALAERLRHARARLLFLYPFLGYLVVNLEDVVAESAGELLVPTAATDGRRVWWNPRFAAALADADLAFVLAHEALHCALMHLWRRGGRAPRRWNVACDIVVNDALRDAGLATALPHLAGGGGRCAEELYEDAAALAAAAGGGEVLDEHGLWHGEGAASGEARAAADGWRAALAQAKGFGRVPAGLERLVEQVLRPRRDWRALLREAISFPEDYHWVPTDRRFRDVLLPTLAGEVHRVVVALDTSGSIDGPQLAAFWAELGGILRDNRCEARVLACDAAVHGEWELRRFDPAGVAALRGGGGTDFAPVFARVEAYAAEGWRPEAVVYLTDLDGHFPDRAPDVRTVWVVERDHGRRTPPFGEVIALEPDRG